MSNNAGNDLGNQIKKAVEDAVGKGDFSELKNLGTAAEKAMKDFGSSFTGTVETRNSQNSQMQKQGPYEPEIVNDPTQKSQPHQPPAWAGSNYKDFFGANKNKKRKNPYSLAPIVLGILGLCVFGVSLLIFMIGLAFFLSSAGMWFGALFSALVTGISGVVTAIGTNNRKFGKRVNLYYELLEREKNLTVAELAAQSGYDVAQVKKDVKKAIAKGVMPLVWFDNTGERLICGEDAYQSYIQKENERKQQLKAEQERLERLKNPQTADLEKFKMDNQETLQKIQKAQKGIQNPEMQRKILQLEDTANDIFTYVEKHPEKMPDIRKLVAYYLPTLLKLLTEYQKYEQVDIRSADVEKAKQDISSTMDTANEAFENLLESLYKEDTLDVKTDIKVFNAMLKQEGLTGKEFDIEVEK